MRVQLSIVGEGFGMHYWMESEGLPFIPSVGDVLTLGSRAYLVRRRFLNLNEGRIPLTLAVEDQIKPFEDEDVIAQLLDDGWRHNASD